MTKLRERKDLTVGLEDLEPIEILPMEKSNAEQVTEKLETAVKKTGICPDALVIDHGPDLYAGGRAFCENHPKTKLKYDVAHKVACELKNRLKDNASWEKLKSQATQTKKDLTISKFSEFAPPKQRVKARYMNVDSLVKWSGQILDQYVKLPKEVQIKTNWLMEIKEEIYRWQDWVQIGQITRNIVRTKGFYEGIDEVLMNCLIKRKLTTKRSEEFAETLIDYLKEEGKGISEKDCLIGSSEVLEGVFGSYKRIAGENKMSTNGLGRLILTMSSRIGEFSKNLLSKALENVKGKDVSAWLSQAFGSNSEKFLEQKQEQISIEPACNF